MNENESASHPILIIVRGLPGSGKSYLAVRLQQSLNRADVVMLDPDATDYDSTEYKDHVQRLTEEGVDPKLHAYRFLRAQAYAGIRNHKIIIWNQPFTNLEIFNKMIANLRLQAGVHNTSLPILVVEVMIDPATARNRVLERKNQGGHGPSDATLERFIGDYISFAEAGYTTVSVKGDDNVDSSVASIMQALRNL